tara:strand:- start:500 stop:1453 length:954 start_codon:yes stop_codon:yes gene_type:complete
MSEILIPETHHDVKGLLNAVIKSCREISDILRNGPIQDEQTVQTNATGDSQHNIDVVTNNILLKNIERTKSCQFIISEENELPVFMDKNAPYCIAFDPLDGSSNIDCNIPTGTIFSIWNAKDVSEKDCLLNTRDVICCGYCIYSAATELIIVFSDSHPPARYILSQDSNKFKLISFLSIPNDSKKICSVNYGNSKHWTDTTKWIVKTFVNNQYSNRYVGSLVADIHRTLLYGGIYLYPSITKPKLRLLYEVVPIAKIITAAGGAVLSETGIDILDMRPGSIHEKIDLICGSERDVNFYRNLHKFSELMDQQNFNVLN